MPVIAYQSLNSNSSSTHSTTASNSQFFTRMTQNRYGQNQAPSFLDHPIAQDNSTPSNVAIQGPANLISPAPSGFMGKGNHTDSQFQSMVMDKSRQTHQVLIRELGTCDLLVYGELDGSSSDWQSMSQSTGTWIGGSSMSKACNCFSAYAHNSNGVTKLAENTGWVAFECTNVVIVFVHVPNAIASSKSSAHNFYRGIAYSLFQLNKRIDVIMGDTNQPSEHFTATVVSSALSPSFAYATPTGAISPSDMFDVQMNGTNSTASKKYDVAIYNTQTVNVGKAIYLSQCTPTSHQNSSFSAAVTDHMGIGLKVTKK